jgi:outer membrane protein TolC
MEESCLADICNSPVSPARCWQHWVAAGGSVGLSQKIPFPGKLSAKGRVVEQAVRIALARLADVRITTVAKVQKAYYGLHLADVSIRINRDSERLLRQIRDVAAARYRSRQLVEQKE